MSDLISMQPNLAMPLYLVAPDERRDKVLVEVNRPTFSRLKPPLNQVCRFISFSALKESGSPRSSPSSATSSQTFWEELSESCELEDV